MKLVHICAALAVMAAPAAADPTTKMIAYAQEQFGTWGSDPTVVAAVNAQNQRNSGLTQDDINALDQQWRAEIKATDQPMINEVLAKPVSEFLSDHVANSQGMITEVFIMDQHGLNVGQSARTSDYWQGDEAKFSETYPNGAGAVHASEVELDESTQTYQSQISLSVVDPATGSVIGAVTFGLNAQAFF